MFLEIIIAMIAISFWASISLTEGWKWRMDNKRADNNSLITYNSYHVWRLITNASWIGLGIILWMSNTSGMLVSFLIANCAGWIFYERLMSFAQYDNFMYKRSDFHILGIYIKRPHPIYEVLFGAGCLAVLTWHIFISSLVG